MVGIQAGGDSGVKLVLLSPTEVDGCLDLFDPRVTRQFYTKSSRKKVVYDGFNDTVDGFRILAVSMDSVGRRLRNSPSQ
jgi:hypothetical protein